MKSKQPLIILGVTGLIILLIIFFMIKPVAGSILSSYKELQEARKNQQMINDKKKVLEGLQSNPNLTNVDEIARKYIPPEQDSGQLVIELTAMAKDANLVVEETSLEKAKEAAPPQDDTATPTPKSGTPAPAATQSPSVSGDASTLDFKMKITGTFTDFMKFLQSVETNSRLMTIKNIATQSKAEAGKPPSFSAQITGTAYYKPKVTLEASLANIEVSQDTINAFLNLRSFGQPINLPSESGFGRQNPFETY